jgi:PST family polysaccharide transporter
VSIARKAVRGAVWTIALSVGSRAFGVIVTIFIAYFIAPEVDGEVKAAWFIAFTASTAMRFGLDQYLIVHQDADDVVFHCTFFMLLLGVLSLGAVLLFGDLFATILKAPNLHEYIPLAVVGVGLRRIAAIPHRVLIRDFRFRMAAMAEALSEIAYGVSTLGLAYLDFGGHSILIGNIVQGGLLLGIVSMATGWQSWLRPCRLTWQRTRDILRFGTPLNFHTLLHIIAHTWDGLVLSYRFGMSQMGLYSKAYSLADIPASHVGEHIGGVLLPSMAKIEPERRMDVLIRSTAILGVLIFPMGVGLGVIAEPLVRVLLPASWQGVTPFLMVLASMSVFRPLTWVVDSYMKVTDRTRLLFLGELLKVALLFTAIWFAPGPVWAAAGVGLAFALQSLFLVSVLAVVDGVSPMRFVPGFVGPIMACGVMAAAVLGVRLVLRTLGVDSAILELVVDIAVGAIVYVPAAFLCAPAVTRDVVGLLRKSFGRGRAGTVG